MSKKPQEYSLLVPGPGGWELWSLNDGHYQRLEGEPSAKPSEITKLPGGQLAMLFPVRSLFALPFRAPSTDSELFDDLAAMHAERHGIRPDPMGGRLSDTFVIASEDEATVLLHAVIQAPQEGDLPLRTPQEFDLSPRAFPIANEGDTLCVWRELGRWVFALYTSGKFLYAQATSSAAEQPDASVVQEIRLAISQLALQGLPFQIDSLFLWTEDKNTTAPGALAGAFDVTPRVEPRPAPIMPTPPSKILPEDVRSARQARTRRNQIIALAACAALLVIAGIGWLGWQFWQDTQKLKSLRAEASEVENVKQAYEMHLAKWSELGPVVDSARSPMELMRVIQASIPANTGMRLSNAEINLNNEEITLSGQAQQSAPVNTFGLALSRRPELRWLEWKTGAPQKTSKGWEFRFQAMPPKQTNF